MDTFEQIRQRMKEAYKQKTGTEVSDGTDIGIRIDVIAAEVYALQCDADWLKRQMFLQTATGKYLDYHGELRSLTRKKGTKARGEVVFFVTEEIEGDYIIPAGIIVSTSDVVPKRFITTEEALISDGAVMSHGVAVEAEKTGSAGNVVAGAINIMVTPPVGIRAVENFFELESGTNDETDDEFRKRLIDCYKNVQNGTNAAYYKAQASNVDGIYSAGVISKNRGIGTIDVFVSGRGTSATNEQVEAVKELLLAKREINLDLQVAAATKRIIQFMVQISTKPGYYFSVVKNSCAERISEYIKSVGVGESFLISAVSEIIYHTEGVENYKIPMSYTQDIVLAQNEFAAVGAITISEIQ